MVLLNPGRTLLDAHDRQGGGQGIALHGIGTDERDTEHVRLSRIAGLRIEDMPVLLPVELELLVVQAARGDGLVANLHHAGKRAHRVLGVAQAHAPGASVGLGTDGIDARGAQVHQTRRASRLLKLVYQARGDPALGDAT